MRRKGSGQGLRRKGVWGIIRKSREGFRSIVVRLRLVFLMSFAVFFLIVIGIMGVQYRKRAEADTIRQLKYEDEILAQSLEARISNIQNSVSAIIINLNQMIPDDWLDSTRGPQINSTMRALVNQCILNALVTYYNADEVIVVWNNGAVWYENWSENYTMQGGGKELLSEMEEQEVDNSGKWLHEVHSSQIAGTGDYFAKRYTDIDTGKRLGYVILKHSGVFESVSAGQENRQLYLFDPDDRLIACSDSIVEESGQTTAASKMAEAQEGSAAGLSLKQQLTDLESDSRQEIHVISMARRYTLISVTDMAGTLSGLNRSIFRILLMAFAASALMFVLVCRLADQIVQPVRILSNHITEHAECFPEPLELPVRNDETGILITRFNEMTKHSRQLIERLVEEKKRQEQLKLSLLQAQIKPHFLYNTLDTIYCLVLMGRKEEAGRMTKLLSDYYRHVLSRGMDWVLLPEEVEQTRKYLEIQQIRYRDILDFHICVDRGVENIRIPKLTLQPLVENAIYHGIKPLGHKGHLAVQISLEERMLIIRIIDDGAGMTPEMLYESLQQDYSSKEGFGLRNVIDRLNLYYETPCGVSLEECQTGTRLKLEITVPPEQIQGNTDAAFPVQE